MARSFDDFDNGASGDACPRCTKRPKAGATGIRLNKFQNGNASRYKQVASRQVSLCEQCAVEVFEILVDTLNDETNGGTRKARSTGSARAKMTDNGAIPARKRRAKARA